MLTLKHLNEGEREHVRQIVEENHDRFFLSGDKLSYTNAAEHNITTIDDFPIHVKQYRYPPVHREEINRQIDDLLSNDIIRLSNSPYNSPLWIVLKKQMQKVENDGG